MWRGLLPISAFFEGALLAVADLGFLLAEVGLGIFFRNSVGRRLVCVGLRAVEIVLFFCASYFRDQGKLRFILEREAEVFFCTFYFRETAALIDPRAPSCPIKRSL
jgi:hypothetical protein